LGPFINVREPNDRKGAALPVADPENTNTRLVLSVTNISPTAGAEELPPPPPPHPVKRTAIDAAKKRLEKLLIVDKGHPSFPYPLAGVRTSFVSVSPRMNQEYFPRIIYDEGETERPRPVASQSSVEPLRILMDRRRKSRMWEMAKVLKCGELVFGCSAVLRGETVDEIIRQAAEHFQTAHNGHDIPRNLRKKLLRLIRDEKKTA
jgi:predicted small metal-binding protein